jgi:hypothetical protein
VGLADARPWDEADRRPHAAHDPRGGMRIVAVEQFQNGFQTFRSFGAMFGINPLPREEKAIKVVNGD